MVHEKFSIWKEYYRGIGANLGDMDRLQPDVGEMGNVYLRSPVINKNKI